MVGGEQSLLWFGIDSVFKILNERMTYSINQSMHYIDLSIVVPTYLKIVSKLKNSICDKTQKLKL